MLNVNTFYVPVKKHGSHDQKTHAGGRGGAIPPTWSKENNFTFGYDENLKLRQAYEAKYKKSNRYAENEAGEELSAVEFYVADGYEEMNAYSRGLETFDGPTIQHIDRLNSRMDNAIDKAPPVVGDKNLYRVYSDRLLTDLQPGDKIVDKGFLSTTRIDITGTSLSSRNTRSGLGSIRDSADTVAVILPNADKNGKGLVVSDFFASNGNNENGIWQREFEVILPRGTELTFLGYQEGEMERVAVFQRNN